MSSQKEFGPTGDPKRVKPSEEVGMPQRRGWVTEQLSGEWINDLTRFRNSPRGGPSASMMVRAAARSCCVPQRVPKYADCHLVARTCGNEVGVEISIRDPYTSPFTSRCKFARCLLLVRCLCSETVAIGFLSSVEPNFIERTALGSLKRRRSYSR